MATAPARPDNIHVWVQANRFAVWFILAVTALFGLFFTWGGIIGLLRRFTADSLVLLVLGIVALVLADRLARYFLLPRMTVAADHLVVRSFWGRAVKWPFAGTTRWQTSVQRIERNWRGRRLPVPMDVERLHRFDSSGSERAVILPGFGGRNGAMLRAVAERSGLAITQKAG